MTEAMLLLCHRTVLRVFQNSRMTLEDAEDAAQEIVVRLLLIEDTEIAEPEQFALTLARNWHRDQHRKALVATRNEPRVVEHWEHQARLLQPTELLVLLAVALEKLSARDRTVLIGWSEGWTHDELAALIGVRQSSVGNLLLRAKRRLQEVA